MLIQNAYVIVGFVGIDYIWLWLKDHKVGIYQYVKLIGPEAPWNEALTLLEQKLQRRNQLLTNICHAPQPETNFVLHACTLAFINSTIEINSQHKI